MRHFLSTIVLPFWATIALNYAAILVGWAGPEWFGIPRETTAPLSASLIYTAGLNLSVCLYLHFTKEIPK